MVWAAPSSTTNAAGFGLQYGASIASDLDHVSRTYLVTTQNPGPSVGSFACFYTVAFAAENVKTNRGATPCVNSPGPTVDVAQIALAVFPRSSWANYRLGPFGKPRTNDGARRRQKSLHFRDRPSASNVKNVPY